MNESTKMATAPPAPISEGVSEVLSDEERHQLLVAWNDTAAEYPQNQCINELFEAQAEKKPEAVALVFADQHLTYRDLNRRAWHS